MNVLVMLPTGTRDEAEEVRRAFAAHGLGCHFASAVAHTFGQTLRGNVVVFSGADEERLKADVERLHRVDGLKQADKAARAIAGQPDEPDEQPDEPDEPPESPARHAIAKESAEPRVEHATGRWFNVVDRAGNVLRERVSRKEAETYVRNGDAPEQERPDD